MTWLRHGQTDAKLYDMTADVLLAVTNWKALTWGRANHFSHILADLSSSDDCYAMLAV